MPKGYLIARVDIHDMEGYKRDYLAFNSATMAKYGAKFLVRGGTSEAPEGTSRSRNVILEFADYATVQAFYHSPEYADLIARRSKHSEADILLIEGYDGPQPTA